MNARTAAATRASFVWSLVFVRTVGARRRRPRWKRCAVNRVQAGADDLFEHGLAGATFAQGALVDEPGEIIWNFRAHNEPRLDFSDSDG
jgi:hypothetical protein